MTDQQVNDLGDSFNNTESIWNSDNWFLNPGEKVLVPEIGYLAYTSVTQMLGGEVIKYP